jgi:hypothetical protein
MSTTDAEQVEQVENLVRNWVHVRPDDWGDWGTVPLVDMVKYALREGDNEKVEAHRAIGKMRLRYSQFLGDVKSMEGPPTKQFLLDLVDSLEEIYHGLFE